MTTEDTKLIYSCTDYAFKVSGDWNDAEDFIQNIFVRILTNPEKFESLNKVEKMQYVFQAIHNQVKDKHRRAVSKGKVKYHIPIEDANKAINPDVYAKMQLKEVMKKGQKNSHFPLLMLHVNGYSCYEIAHEKNISVNTVVGKFRYARKFLNSNESL